MDFTKLNAEQLEAVTFVEGPVLILAGPGTGKTFTIAKRVANLIINKSVKPESILISTFTKKAATELKIKIALELKENNFVIDIERMKIGTLHSIFQEIIESQNYILLNEFEQRYMLYKNSDIFKKLEGYEEFIEKLRSKSKLPISSLVSYFSKLDEYNIELDTLITSKYREIQLLGIFYSAYKKILEQNSSIDFGKIQLLCLELLNKNKELLAKLNSEIDYIIIDEYQDTNKLQNEIIFKLAGEKQNICVVGDDDQSIYRFRGATVDNILNFTKHFEKNNKICKVINLKANYRSHSEIIKFYSEFIKRKDWGLGRKEKFLFSGKQQDENQKNIEEIPRVMKISAKTNLDYVNELAIFIKKLKSDNIIEDYSQIAFLSSSARYSDFTMIIHKLNQEGIKTYSPRTGDFFYREEIKMFLGLAIIFYQDYFEKLKKSDELNYEIHHTYYRDCVNTLKNYTVNSEREISKWIKTKLDSLPKDNFEFMPIFYEFFKFNYCKNIFTQKDDEEIKEYELKEKNISILANKISEYEEKNKNIFSLEFFESYLPFMIEQGVNEYEDEEDKIVKNHISFLTLHQSKGLEFPIVFITNLINEPIKVENNKFKQLIDEEIYGITKQQFEEDSLSDFYRLYYTGFSRAQNFLFLASLDNREKNMKKQSPSLFFAEIFDNLPDYKKYADKITNSMVDSNRKAFITKRFSFTGDISLYSECPIKYRFFRQSKFPQINNKKEYLGTFIHGVIDKIHRDIISKVAVTENRIKYHFNEFQNLLFVKFKVEFSDEELKQALESIMEYIKNNQETLIYIKESELNLSYIRKNYILHGNLDLLKEKNNECEIIDFKTSNVKPENIPLNYEKQLYLYNYLAKNNNYNIKKMKLYYTSDYKEPTMEIFYDENKEKNILEEFDEIVEKILENKVYDKTNNKNYCKECQLRYFCDEE